MHEAFPNKGPRYGLVKALLILLLLCNMVYIFCKEFKASLYLDTEADDSSCITSAGEERQSSREFTLKDKQVDGCQRNQTAVYMDRRLRLEKMCNYSQPNLTSQYLSTIPRVITVDPAHPILYCPMQKVASSFWVRILTIIGSQGKYSNPFQITLQDKTLVSFKKLLSQNQLTSNQTNEFMSKLFPFMFVRDPYSRLFSGYVDKVYYPNTIFWPGLIDDIIDAAGEDKSHMDHLSPVTFAQFIKYILKMFEDDIPLDKHFAPMHTLCDPCAVKYSFLGKLETFLDDTDYLLSKWKNEFEAFKVTFVDFSREAMLDDTIRHVSMLFNVIVVMQNTSDDVIQSILERGWVNLKLRGYIDKDRGLPFAPDELRNVTMDAFMELVKTITLNEPLAKDRAKQQRTEAMVQAYRTLSTEDLEKLRLFVLEDCNLFGYDDRPAKIFNRDTTSVSEFSYFSDL